jgi:hypothetical protein
MAMISQEDRPEFGGEAFQASLATTKVFNPSLLQQTLH